MAAGYLPNVAEVKILVINHISDDTLITDNSFLDYSVT
jgi:hypothetical protein